MNIVFKHSLWLLIFIPFLAQSQDQGALLQELISQMESAHAQGKTAAEMGLAREAADLALHLDEEQKYTIATLRLAEGHLASGNIEEAQNQLRYIAQNVADFESLPVVRRVTWHRLQGQTWLQLGYFDRALPEGETALAIVRNLTQPDPALEAQALDFLGIVRWTLGEYERALDRHQQALILREQLFGEGSREAAGSLINLGLVYSSQERWEKAITSYHQATKALEASNIGQNTAYLSALTNLGVAYLSSPEPQLVAAEEAFEAAEQGWTSRLGAKHPNTLFLKAYRGQVAHRKGAYETALDLYQEVREGYATHYNGHHPDLANLWNLTGQTHRAMGNFNQAVIAHQQALVTNFEDFNPENEFENPSSELTAFQQELVVSTLQFKAQALEARYFGLTVKKRDLEGALACLTLAQSQVTKLRQKRVREADRLALGKLAADISRGGVRVCEALSDITLFAHSYDQQAFVFAEAAKASVLQQALAESEARSFAGVPDSLVAQERDLVTRAAYFEQQIAEDPYHKEIGNWYAELARLRILQDRLTDRIESEYPQYYALKYQNQGPTVSRVQESLAEGNVLLSYFLRPEDRRISIFLLTQTDFRVVHAPLGEDFEEWITAMRNYLTYSVEQGYDKITYPLYQQLFPKSLRLPKTTRQIIIVPHQQLSLIPWEALITEPISTNTAYRDYPFLIKQHALSYAYSAGLFMQLQQQKASQGSRGMYLMAPVDFAAQSLSALPSTLDEINTIADLARGNQLSTSVYSGPEASESKFRQEILTRYRILHLATHGEIDPNTPSLSRLYFSSENATNALADGQLYTGDIFGLQLDADLVCLSACETGLGQFSSGEGLLGLSRAFLFAGSRRLIVSLWSVNDQSTAQLTTGLYQHAFQDQLSWSEALQKSKLMLIEKGVYAAPYYWAPFILVGKP